MGGYAQLAGGERWHFQDLKCLLAAATPLRSGDVLAGVAACSDTERVAAQMALADLPLKAFLNEAVIPYESDEVSRLILDNHDASAFALVSHLTVGDFRNWLLSDECTEENLKTISAGLTPEMAAAVSKIMRLQDLVLVTQKIRVKTAFRNTMGLKGRMSTRLQPNSPTDSVSAIAASVLDGLMYGNGDAMIGINPATDSLSAIGELLEMLDSVVGNYSIPTQTCVLTHITSTIELINRGKPVDLVFQS